MSIVIPGCILPPDDRMDLVLCIQHDGTVLDPWGNQINTKAIELPPHAEIIDYDSLIPDSEWSDYEDGYTAYSMNAIRAACTPADPGEGGSGNV